MSKKPQPERRQQVVEAALAEFLAKGYRLTQISGIAQRLGIAPGTIYLYFESKDAIFDAVARFTAGIRHPDAGETPVRTPRREDTLSFVRSALESRTSFPKLELALAAPSPDPRAEFEGIVREIYRGAFENAAGIKLVERCASDWPELAQLWFGTYRAALQAKLERYLRRSFADGRLRAGAPPDLVARLILELVAALAVHCRFDRLQPLLDDEMAEAVVADALTAAYAAGVAHISS